jgi:hypothetical protein
MIKQFLYIACLFLFIAQAKSQSTTVTFTPNNDALVTDEPGGDANNNYGTSTSLYAYSWTSSGTPYNIRSYIGFNLSSIPTGAKVCSASLTMYTTSGNDQSGYDYPNTSYLKKVTSTWSQSTVTWNTQPSFSSTDTIPFGPTTGTVATINVTSDVQNMVSSSSTNYGWAMMLKNEANYYAALVFYSSDYTTASLRPLLTVTYVPSLTVTPTSTAICSGHSSTLTVSGATAYSWTPSSGLSVTTGTNVVATPTASTTYTVTGTTGGCSNTATIAVTVNALPTLTVSPSTTVCAGTASTLTVSGASTYVWSPGTGLSTTTGSTTSASPSSSTNYTVTGTNSSGCVNTKTVSVTVNPLPTVTVNSDTIYGSLSGTLTAHGATTYSWTPSTGLSITTGSVVVATPTVTTIYTVTGTTNSCSSIATTTVTNLNLYFRSAATGNWNNIGTWQSSVDNSTWSSATVPPDYRAHTITIQASHIVSVVASVTIDETVVNGELAYNNTAGSTIGINDGTGIDLTVNGSFADAGPNDINWLGSSSWTIGSSGSLIRSSATSSDKWRNQYSGGISTIPATANWIVIKTGTANPLLSSTSGMYYPNLTIENTTLSTWTTTSVSSFTGSAAPPVILGNLNIGGSGIGNVSFLDTNTNASGVLVKGNLSINGGSVLRSHGTGFEVQGNLALNGTVDYGTSNAAFILSGSNSQTISGSSISFKNMTLNKASVAATVTLNSPATITGTLTLLNGLLITDTIHLLTFNAGSSATGVNDSSFISGPVKKIGNTAFTFPLGKNKNSQTITISAPTTSTDAFQAEYFDTNPTLTDGTTTDTTFNYVSTCQFFNLLRKNGTSNIKPTLSFDLSSCVTQLVPAPRVIGYNGTKWKDLGESNFVYSNFAGSISSATVITQYGHITLGNNTNGYSPIDTVFVNLNPTPPVDFNAEQANPAYNYFPNKGQIAYVNSSYTPANWVKYYTEFTSPKMFFGNTSMSFLFTNSYPINDTVVADSSQRIDLTFGGSSDASIMYGYEPTNTFFNYILGYLSSSGISHVIGNQRLVSASIYPNIDLHIFSNQKGLKYYFVLNPGANISFIKQIFSGADSTSLKGDSLTIHSFLGKISLKAPISYQVNDSLHASFTTDTISWASAGTNTYGFHINSYNKSIPLIIEVNQGANSTTTSTSPYWSTFVPGNADDAGRAITYDKVNDEVYIGGETSSSAGPTSIPIGVGPGGFQHKLNTATDGFILNFGSSRQLGWGTYIGGDGSDYVHKIKYSTVDGGRLYIVGETFSSNSSSTGFPLITLSGAYNQTSAAGSASPSFGTAYLARLTTTGAQPTDIGQPDWITFFGSEYGNITGIDEDPTNNNIYITGSMFNIPSSTHACSASSYLFSLCSSAATGSGTPYVEGLQGVNQPSVDVGSDGFVAMLSSAGILGWGTMLGGKSDDYLTSVAVDATNGFVYVAGNTYGTPGSTNCTGAFPKCGGTGAYVDNTNSSTETSGDYNFSDCLLAKFSTTDFSLKWLTLFGGGSQDEARGIEIDNSGNAYVIGITKSISPTASTACNIAASSDYFPACYTSPQYGQAFDYTGGTPTGCFIAKFDVNNALTWSTYISGDNTETYLPSSPFWTGSPSISIDDVNGDIYMCGTSYSSSAPYTQSSSDFDYYVSSNSQGVTTASNAFILAFDGTTNALDWGTFYGGVGYKNIADPIAGGGDYPVGDMGMDIVGSGGNVFLTGLSYSQSNFPISVPPSSGTYISYSQLHSSGSNSDAYVAEFNATGGVAGIKNQMNTSIKINEYLVYPNPNTGQFTIKGNIPEKAQIQVVNTLGQLVYSTRQENAVDETALNLGSLANGVYMLNIIKGTSVSSQKIFIFK